MPQQRGMLVWLPVMVTLSLMAALVAGGTARADEQVWSLLKAGGQVVLIRHTTTTPGVGDPPGMRLDDCSTQRNLSEQGRRDARRIGETFRSRGIPVGLVLSSPWCRCLETGRLAFGSAEPWEPLGNLFGRPERREEQMRQMRPRVGEPPAPGNLVLVSHGSTISALTGVMLGPGEIVVVTPQGNGTEFAALGLLARQHAETAAPELRAAIAEDRDAIWRMGWGRGPALTLKNAVRIVQDAGRAAWLPAQAGLVHVAATRTLWRPGRVLITLAQLDVLVPRIEPGDILLVRRHWYLSDLGLPGFWPHVALYVGLPEERRRLAADPAVRAWVRERGQPDGDLEALLRAAHPVAYASHGERAHGRARRVLEAISAGVGFGSLERLAADSLAVLRPRLPAVETAQALLRAFGYAGRPYDFEFDFRTDAALVCTEVVYKAYEPGQGMRGLRWAVPEILGRPVLPPNDLVRQFDAAVGTPDQQLDLVVFLDGEEGTGTAVQRGLDAFRASWRRPKWPLVMER